jgi:hypothetical protein
MGMRHFGLLRPEGIRCRTPYRELVGAYDPSVAFAVDAARPGLDRSSTARSRQQYSRIHEATAGGKAKAWARRHLGNTANDRCSVC